MSYETWQKGSQWRKWDLHVHTPASFHWNGGKFFHDMSAAEKDESFSELFNVIENSDVAVFCFTDYWTFDGYIQFIDYLSRNNISCTKTIFPGIELRVEAPTNYRLNIQVILSNLLSNQQLADFKSKLLIGSIERQISDEAIIEFAQTLDASKSKAHGFGDPKKLDKNELLKLGSSTVEVTKESLNVAIKAIKPGSAYLVLPFDTDGGISKLDWKTQPHAANYFMQFADVVESRRKDTIDLFLGNETDKNRDYLENFQKTINYVQKPVICGSDAHRYSDYGKFPGNKATWIKSNPTFEGFKQIIYEPRDRVQIQELQPQGKIPYRVIEKIRFIDKTNQKRFSSDWIFLNENLNAIIGGKSSGKSLMLYHIAKAIAPSLVEKRAGEVKILDYSFGSLDEFDFEVVWEDDHSDKLSTLTEDGIREIEYIPQLYVNALAEKQGKASLYNLIESILYQNVDYRDFIQQIKQEIAALEITIDNSVSELLRKREDLKILYEERKVIGDQKGIEAEIDKLSTKIEELRNDSDFTSDEKIDFEKLTKRQADHRKQKQKYSELANAIDSFNHTIEQIKKHSLQSLERTDINHSPDAFSKRVLSFMKTGALNSILRTFDLLISSNKSLAENARGKSKKFADKERKILERLAPYLAKVRDQSQLKDYEEKLKEQHKIQKAYHDKTSLINQVKEAGVNIKNELFGNYADLLQAYKQVVEKLSNDSYARIDADILLDVGLGFDSERFSSSFCELFNRRRTNFSVVFGDSFSTKNEYEFEEKSHLQKISKIFDVLSPRSNVELIFRQGQTREDAITQLFKNNFQIEYNIQYKNDEILDMSPGKRGLVLLQLILHISNATHPILIDQPEDNLDNRTISDELKKFIAAKKLTRQIIMVTHDANLVVLTDAENIIVSNQDGQQMDRENAEYRFEYVAGALENSFRIPETEPVSGILYSCGIREHVCDVLEGGEIAFKKREEKYGFSGH